MITKMKQILGAAAAMLMLAACGSPKTNLPLEGTQWKLTEMDGKADPAFAAGEDTFNFTLDPSRMMVYGVGACNRLFGPYELEEGNGLDIERLASTMMACPNMDLESRFAKLLEEADKYEIDGGSQDTVIAARELALAGNDNRNWVNDHTVYTHGYGVVAAYGNKVTADGQPEFFESGIPTQGKLTESEKYEPRIYFSPNTTEYSILGAPEGTQAWEFDYPTGSEGALTTFKGDGGPSVGNLFSRILYAIRFGSDQILFSDRVTSESQILYDRSPKERVAKVAPYLTLDGRVYPAVVDGRVKWIVDGYTPYDP